MTSVSKILVMAITIAWSLNNAALAQSGSMEGTVPRGVLAAELALEPGAKETPAAASLERFVEEFDVWEGIAERAEGAVGATAGTNFALSKLRVELVDWREKFADIQSVHTERIETVQSQIRALGVPLERGEAEPLVLRRQALSEQLSELSAPRLLADEAYARADGLIGEIDTILRSRQASEVLSRGELPILPANWGKAFVVLEASIEALITETVSLLKARYKSGHLLTLLPLSLLFLVLGGALLFRGRRWAVRLWDHHKTRSKHWETILHACISLASIALPYLGLVLVSLGLVFSNLFGVLGLRIVQLLPAAGANVLVAQWLGIQFFKGGRFEGPIKLSKDERELGLRLAIYLGWLMALGVMLRALLEGNLDSQGIGSVILFPFVVFLSLLLFRVGNLLYQHRNVDLGDTNSMLTLIGLVGRLTMVCAVLGPILAAFGYSEAYRVLIEPAINSLALIGTLLIIHDLATELHAAYVERNRIDGQEYPEGLGAFFLSAVLVLLSVPFFALIWGARVEDLVEIWTRFREGFSLGDTKISPTDLLTFVLVFALGYMITRLVQNMLRNTILPKTKLDIGGRNAIVSGIGYTGIFLAALIAITSAGIDLSSLAIVAGALSVGIGFGLQNIVSNFVSGIILLIERPISEGDLIEVGSQAGFVRSISVRSTRIETFDRTDVIVPNADLVSTQVTNWTRGNSVGRVVVPVGVAYGTDIDKVTAILKDIADNHPLVVFDPEPQVMMIGFGADSIDFEIRAIIRDVKFKLHTKNEMNHEIAKRFSEAGIEIPFAQRDIWIRNAEALYPPQNSVKGSET